MNYRDMGARALDKLLSIFELDEDMPWELYELLWVAGSVENP